MRHWQLVHDYKYVMVRNNRYADNLTLSMDTNSCLCTYF